MPTEDEIRFAQARGRIQDAICACFSIAELLLPLRLIACSALVDSIVGSLQADTLSGQQLVQSRTYASSGSASHEKIDVAIGHTGLDWTPIVTISSSSSDPEQVIFNGKFNDAITKLNILITNRIRLIQ